MVYGPKPYTLNTELLEGQSLPSDVYRWALAIEYNGAAFHGFQAQKSGVATVQHSLELALSKVADEPIKIICAGRTDTGVHATNQIVHFDTHAVRKDRAFVFGTNTHLPASVVVRWSKAVQGNFHARFSAHARTYRYVICNSYVRPALAHDQLSWQRHPLDESLMQQAAMHLIGEHDFSSLRASQCQAKSPVRTIHHIHIQRRGDLVILEIQANAFLHHMVRNIVGVLMEVGMGEQPISWVPEVLAARNRCEAADTASPAGLYLVHVAYPDHFDLPEALPGPHHIYDEIGGFAG